ncbi:MAG: hypothetical protein ACNA8W_23950 [Bradymonadaceae bacterium]
MSHFPADKMGYYDAILLFFMELTGRAIMFSGRDLESLSRWRSEGASVAVICQGIEDAFESMDRTDPPRNVYGCRHHIEPLVEKARKNAAGRHGDASEASSSPGDGVFAEALSTVEGAGKAAASEDLKEIYRRTWKRLRDLGDGADQSTFEELAAIEQSLAEGYFKTLAAAERQKIEERIAGELVSLGTMGADAKREHVQARRRLLLIRDYGMPTLWA